MELLLTDRVPQWDGEDFLARRTGPITQTVVTRKIRFSGQNPDFWAKKYVLSEEEKPPFSQMNFSLTLRGELI